MCKKLKYELKIVTNIKKKNIFFIIKAEIKHLKGEMSPIELETGLKLMRLQQIFQFNNTIINQVF
jgi:hypothetical protein